MRIDGWMTSVVMLLYVLHVHCFCNSRNLVHVLRVVEKIGIFSDHFFVRFEVDHVNLKKKKRGNATIAEGGTLQIEPIEPHRI